MKFKPGDRVRVVRGKPPVKDDELIPLERFVGRVGKVEGLMPAVMYLLTGATSYYYCVSGVEGLPPHCYINEDCLELVPPDKEQTFPWSQCVWAPKSERVI